MQLQLQIRVIFTKQLLQIESFNVQIKPQNDIQMEQTKCCLELQANRCKIWQIHTKELNKDETGPEGKVCKLTNDFFLLTKL